MRAWVKIAPMSTEVSTVSTTTPPPRDQVLSRLVPREIPTPETRIEFQRREYFDSE
jgi:hypothetical protein